MTATATVAISHDGPATETTEAVAEGGSVDTLLAPNGISAISVSLPDKTYATTLIDGASNVADALLGPGDKIFGAAILFDGGSTFDFRYQGDLLLGVIDGSDFDIVVNGDQIFAGGSANDAVVNLGSNFGPNIELTITGFGTLPLAARFPKPRPGR